MVHSWPGVRTILNNLFVYCDFGQTGLVDRQRILQLLNMFYDSLTDMEIKASLKNPRKWPVVEFEEEEDEVENFIAHHLRGIQENFFLLFVRGKMLVYTYPF